ncbi:MAG: hypothetical protein U5K70_05195 [Halodesulfurarchaeum sp.]|nr:hypothetical protein [Halodesulfurarchaeum sp.]
MDTPDAGGEMTLAFDLSALQALAEPGTAFADARQWTRYAGVVSAEEPTHVLTNFTRKRRIREDFFSGPKGAQDTLESVREQFESDRYVMIGTTERDRERAEAAGWEYLPVEEAADAAGWTVGEQRKPDGEPDREDWP